MMAPAKPNRASLDLAASRWKREWVRLRQNVEADPESPSAWLSQIRIDIYEYLLRRYANEELDLPSPSVEPRPATALELPSDTPPTRIKSVAGSGPFSLWAEPPKPRAAVRSHLGRISQANTPRYDRYEKERADRLRERLIATDQLDGLIQSILERHRQEHPHQPLNDFSLRNLILDEVKGLYRP
ncbi:MAG: hypothetical protein AAGA25_16585 [Planctomycetota bacterium]